MANILINRVIKRILLMLAIISLSFYTLSYFIIFHFEILYPYQVSIILLTILSLALLGFFVLAKTDEIYEPMVVFSAYFLTVIVSATYFISTDFLKARNFGKMVHDYIPLFEYTLLYFLLGYIFALVGYYMVKKNGAVAIKLESQAELPDNILTIVAAIFLAVGILNFTYNVLAEAGGSILVYMRNVAVRKLELEKHGGGSTLGYLFAYNAMYLWYFKLLRQNKGLTVSFITFLMITILIRASTGRIMSTITYGASFVVIYYYISLSLTNRVNIKKYILMFIGAGVFGVMFYFLRIISSLEYKNMVKVDVISLLFMLVPNIMHFAADSGNIPNIPVVMRIIRDWSSDMGYLYGKSLLSPILHILPSKIRPEGWQPSVLIKETWFANTLGGNLPPTGIGEMYANFGFLGPIFGMMLFGLLCGLIYNYFLKSRNFWVLVIYSNILLGFILIYPKGEFDNLSLTRILPIVFTILGIKMVIKASRNISLRRSMRDHASPLYQAVEKLTD